METGSVQHNAAHPHHHHTFAKSPLRWSVLAWFAAANCMNAFLWICFSPVYAAVMDR
jgi:MFS transporter, FLVCR family, MFS-domain-containing protein 7